MKLVHALLSAIGASLLVGAAHAAMPSTVAQSKQVLTVNQAVSLSGSPAVSAKVGPLLNSDRGYGTRLVETKVVNPSAIGTMLVPTIPSGSTEAAVLKLATQHFKAYGPSLAQNMQAWMKTNGVTFAWFSYEQRLNVYVPKAAADMSGGSGATVASTQERMLVWTMSTDHSGRLIFGDPRVIAPEPVVVYAVYVPSAVEAGLPQDWKYPDAGQLLVQTRNKSFVELTSFEVIQTNGAFDELPEPVVPEGETAPPPSYNADAGLRCLVNHETPGCDPNQVSVRKLMDERGASLAILDYVRKVQPVYEEKPVGSGTLVPKPNLAIRKRIVNFNGCSAATYYNEGSWGFELKRTLDRYIVGTGGAYSPMQQLEQAYQSPTQAYSGTVTVAAGQMSSLSNYIIDPLKPESSVLLAVNELPQPPVELAPVENSGTPATTVVYRETPYIATGGNRLNAHLYVGCDAASDTIRFSVGFKDQTQDVQVNWNVLVNRYSNGAVFTRGKAASLPVTTREDPMHASCVGTATYDGNATISLSMNFGCTYGENLLKGNVIRTLPSGYEWDDRGLESLFPRYCPAGKVYASASGQKYGYIPGSGGGEGGESGSYDMVSASQTGCAYDSRAGLSIEYYWLRTYGPVDAGCSGSGDGYECHPWLGVCPNPADTPIFTAWQQSGGWESPSTTYTARTCVAVPTTLWSVSW